jgi:hypothetical protein
MSRQTHPPPFNQYITQFSPVFWYLISLTYLLTYLLTPWCSILFEKLIVTQLVKKYPAFLRKPKVHHRVHKARHWTLSWASWIQFAPSIPISLRSILMLSSPPHFPWFNHPTNIRRRIPLYFYIFSSVLCSQKHSIYIFPQGDRQILHSYKITGKIIILYSLISKYLEVRRNINISELTDKKYSPSFVVLKTHYL